MDLVLLLLLVSTVSRAQLLHHHEEEDMAAGVHFDIDSVDAGGGSGCIYCLNVSSNAECNRFAIEMHCPTDQPVCYSHHVMDGRGGTLSVTKRCTTEETCSSQVGCRRDKSANRTVCVSCCETSYCNEDVAINGSMAVFHRASGDRTAAFSSAIFNRSSPCCSSFILLVLLLLQSL